MNSETPANSESDQIIFEPAESSNPNNTLDEPTTEPSSAVDLDMWSSESTTSDTPELDIESELSELTEPESSDELADSASFEAAFDLSTESDSDANADLNAETNTEPDLFVDTWLDEPSTEPEKIVPEASKDSLESDRNLTQLEQQKTQLQQEIAELQAQKEQLMLAQVREVQETMARIVEEGMKELVERKTALRIEIEKLERRQARINQEMRSSFAGSSKELAIRVQGFKEYLVGSLQDLASAADKLELTRTENPPSTSRRERVRGGEEPRREGRNEGRDRQSRTSRDNLDRRAGRDSSRPTNRRQSESRGTRGSGERNIQGQFSEPTFADQSRRIRQLLDKYCNSPDYYGSPWQLRRTFDRSQAQKVQEWFFSQGGRGAIDSMGSRLQNILVASCAISILHDLYQDRAQFLVLTDTPENLGEWRKGLEDCLGISRRDFGTNRGIVLFDSPDVLVQRAERLIADKLLPVIVVDETEELLNLSVLKFPIWLAFASVNRPSSTNYLY